jgi:hypothetical protein
MALTLDETTAFLDRYQRETGNVIGMFVLDYPDASGNLSPPSEFVPSPGPFRWAQERGVQLDPELVEKAVRGLEAQNQRSLDTGKPWWASSNGNEAQVAPQPGQRTLLPPERPERKRRR